MSFSTITNFKKMIELALARDKWHIMITTYADDNSGDFIHDSYRQGISQEEIYSALKILLESQIQCGKKPDN